MYCEVEDETRIRKEILTLESGRNNWSQIDLILWKGFAETKCFGRFVQDLLLKLTTSSNPPGSSGDFNDMIIFMASNSLARSREWAENHQSCQSNVPRCCFIRVSSKYSKNKHNKSQKIPKTSLVHRPRYHKSITLRNLSALIMQVAYHLPIHIWAQLGRIVDVGHLVLVEMWTTVSEGHPPWRGPTSAW